MTLDQYFDRPDSCYFVPDPGKLAAYCRENWEEEDEKSAEEQFVPVQSAGM